MSLKHIPVLVTVAVIAIAGASCHSDQSSESSRSRRSDNSGSSVNEMMDIDWRLTNLRGSPVEPAPAGARAPQLRLSSEGQRVSGYTGVNDFNGTFELAGSTLHFSPLAMTRRTALPPLMRLESSFVEALHETSAWRRAGADIELLDVAGQPLARFTRNQP